MNDVLACLLAPSTVLFRSLLLALLGFGTGCEFEDHVVGVLVDGHMGDDEPDAGQLLLGPGAQRLHDHPSAHVANLVPKEINLPQGLAVTNYSVKER